jgi:hypothetical protein
MERHEGLRLPVQSPAVSRGRTASQGHITAVGGRAAQFSPTGTCLLDCAGDMAIPVLEQCGDNVDCWVFRRNEWGPEVASCLDRCLR